MVNVYDIAVGDGCGGRHWIGRIGEDVIVTIVAARIGWFGGRWEGLPAASMTMLSARRYTAIAPWARFHS